MTAVRPRTKLIVPLTQTTVPAMRVAMHAADQAGADMVECRLDHLDSPSPADLAELLTDTPLPAIVTLRPVRQGGRYEGDEPRRLALLAAAAEAGGDYVDVEDDVPAADRPAGKIVLSHHDFARRPADLDAVLQRIDDPAAAVPKVAFASAGPEDAVAALDALRRLSRPGIALAMGEPGVMSRLLAGKFGAFGTFAALEAGAESAPGQPTIADFRDLYRWDAIGPDTAVYGVIGCPLAHSMSPAVHNRAFETAGVDAVYVPLRVEPGAEHFNRFLDAVRGADWLGVRGLSVTIPHKENALARADEVDELSRRIGAVNTLQVRPDGSLRGWNTDYAGATDALCEAMGIARDGLAGRSVAVLGAGGAARAIVAAMAHYGAEVIIYNRTVSRGQKLAGEFGAAARGLDALAAMSAEIVINCTSLGMHPNVEATPVPAEALAGVSVVFDTVYNPLQTRLLREAAEAGCRTVSGVDMFVNQAAAQFEPWTGKPAPRELMRQVVLDRLSRRNQE
ncbi:MAG TPA: shikimate dehydrogenase [Phycisphaerae bacterium]|nr:shikimate dehydrogenase [Phycisphaerae bacterium]